MEWWEDLWLNEGFASFFEFLGVSHAEGDWQMVSPEHMRSGSLFFSCRADRSVWTITLSQGPSEGVNWEFHCENGVRPASQLNCALLTASAQAHEGKWPPGFDRFTQEHVSRQEKNSLDNAKSMFKKTPVVLTL